MTKGGGDLGREGTCKASWGGVGGIMEKRNGDREERTRKAEGFHWKVEGKEEGGAAEKDLRLTSNRTTSGDSSVNQEDERHMHRRGS